jgi:putative phosphotransacetylase
MLSQPGQFASEERVTITGPKGSFKNVIIIGPLRKESQVEVSLSDARVLGVTAPIRESGDLKGSAPITISGPNGEIEIPQGCIAAQRHIHFTPADAAKFNIKDKEIAKVKIACGGRALIFDDVVCRVREDYAFAMHIDTDEANAAACSGEVYGEIIKK